MVTRERPEGLTGERPSASAEAARRAELERIAAMSPRERALLALRLGRTVARYAELGRRA
jgi:hypothetical protein